MSRRLTGNSGLSKVINSSKFTVAAAAVAAYRLCHHSKRPTERFTQRFRFRTEKREKWLLSAEDLFIYFLCVYKSWIAIHQNLRVFIRERNAGESNEYTSFWNEMNGSAYAALYVALLFFLRIRLGLIFQCRGVSCKSNSVTPVTTHIRPVTLVLYLPETSCSGNNLLLFASSS